MGLSSGCDASQIPFCSPDYGQGEILNLKHAIALGKLEGGGYFTKMCEESLQSSVGCGRALIVPSCTAALEMMALAMNIRPGDEIIMPSYTFVSTANAIALRGGVPVFVDIDASTLNINVAAAAAAISPKTRAIMAVHYAGVGCDMDGLQSICAEYELDLLEDAAQAVGATWRGQVLGSFGRFGAFSFHHTKNVTCGEGGALLVNDLNDVQKSEIIRDKGTDRADFLRGQVVKYEWQSLGSSFLLSELAAAVLAEQLSRQQELKNRRLTLWERYDETLSPLSGIRTPVIPSPAKHNAHIYHLRLPKPKLRDELKKHLAQNKIVAAPHYVPLHLTPAGMDYGKFVGELVQTIDAAETLLRLPIYSGMAKEDQSRVISEVLTFSNLHGLC